MKIVRQTVVYALILVLCAMVLAPLVWVVTGSGKTKEEIAGGELSLWPAEPQWRANYVRAWWYEARLRLGMGQYFLNSLLIATTAVLAQLFSSSLVAYGFARVRFRGREALFLLLLATMMIPGEVTMIPLFIIFRKIGWTNSFLPLIVPQFFGSAFNIFLLRQFFMTIPRELDEAAMIDGCSRFGVYWRIILPLSAPALVVTGIFTFLWNWKDLLGPLIYLDALERRTVPLGLSYLLSPTQNEPGVIFAAATLALVPVLILFFIGQRYITKGITLSATTEK
ncbi:MAG TPA: carbohydrate ABC transporter permease [Planctomycetota bacterium]|nr:carbohydrate ABC transporter permease [Planctomycetota bacterium]HUV39791.1 carbohydrate ABC transporter permease [Planctomycetota bacterium]